MRARFLSGLLATLDRVTGSPLLVAVGNAGVLVVTTTMGWMVANVATPHADTVFGIRDGVTAPGFLYDVGVILGANGTVLALAFLGAVTCGLLGLLVVMWNGFNLGYGFAGVVKVAPSDALALLRYLPLEFAAIVLASSAGMLVARSCGEALFEIRGWRSRSHRLAVAALFFAIAALVLIVLAAVMEAKVRGELLACATPC